MRPRSMMAVSAALAGLLAVTACSGGGGSKADVTKAPTAAEQLATAKKTLDDAASVHLTLRSQDVPKSVDGVLGADGDGTHAPAFKGTFDARLKGLQASVPVIAVEGSLYLKLPFAPAYIKTDPQTYNAPDPASFFAPDHGITTLLPATKDPVLGETARDGKEVVRTITGTLPGKAVADLLVIGDQSGSYQVTYGIVQDDNQLRTVKLTGPFFPGATSTYTLRLDHYGDPVEINKP